MRIDTSLARRIRKAERAVLRRFAAHFEAADVTPLQLGVLDHLVHHPEARPTELSVALDLQKTNVRLPLAQLEARGWIRKVASPTDGRSYHVEVTTAGASAHRRLNAVHDALEAEVRAPLTAQEQEQLLELLQRLVDSLAKGD